MKKGVFIALVAILVIGAYVSGNPTDSSVLDLLAAGWDGLVGAMGDAVRDGNALILLVALPALFMFWRLLKLVLFPDK